jgi:hypothetical protein
MGKIIISSQLLGPLTSEVAFREASTICEEKGLNFEKIKKELLEQTDSKGFLQVYDNYFKEYIKII